MNNLFSLSILTAVSDNLAYRQSLNTAAAVLLILLVPLCILAVVLEIMRMRAHRADTRKALRILTIPVYCLAVCVLVFAFYCKGRLGDLDNPQLNQPSTGASVPSSAATAPSDPTVPTEPTQPTTPTQPAVIPTPTLPVTPHYTDKTNPSNWNVQWKINVDGQWVESYQRPDSIYFGSGDNYFTLPGIAGFRGDNYRSGATYGTVNVTEKKLTQVWQKDIGSLPKPSGSGSWTGSGWTGQPLVVEWDAETKAIMNLYPAKKAKAGLVEVIYATLDGNIYFYDLEDGSYTRDPLKIGMAFKGAGALDPRGYPIMYVGSGDRTKEGKEPRMYIINLINCTVMYEYGHVKEYNTRNWRAFDASPLVDAKTDTLIWPGENGLLYTIKLNTNYNKSAGTLSINPDKPVLNWYMTSLNTDPQNDLGMENSPIVVEGYLYVGDNRGSYFCVDLNTMKLVWSQEIKDDMNATAVFEWGEDGNGYIYLGTSTEHSKDTCYMYKLNAATGEIVWEVPWTNVQYDKLVSGGVLSTPLLGKKGTVLEGLIIFPVAKTPGAYSGVLLALDTENGNVVWKKDNMKYCWSSPVAVYSDDGNAYIVLFDSVGTGFLLDGKTGQELNTISVKTWEYTNVEASPIVYNDMIIIGTRSQAVFGIKIS